MVDIIAITAISGILIGAMNLTGVAFSLTQQLLSVSGGSLGLLLVITAFAAFILGLPLPTVGVYVILATLAAPALVQAGILPMQAHMFVLFNGILGMVTPPVALAAFAAATIAAVGPVADRLGGDAHELVRLFHPVHVRLLARADHAGRPDRDRRSALAVCTARHLHGNDRRGRLSSGQDSVALPYRLCGRSH